MDFFFQEKGYEVSLHGAIPVIFDGLDLDLPPTHGFAGLLCVCVCVCVGGIWWERNTMMDAGDRREAGTKNYLYPGGVYLAPRMCIWWCDGGKGMFCCCCWRWRSWFEVNEAVMSRSETLRNVGGRKSLINHQLLLLLLNLDESQEDETMSGERKR